MPRNRDVEKWRAHAARARERAAGMPDDEAKRMQLAIAVAYDKLAERAEVSAQTPGIRRQEARSRQPEGSAGAVYPPP